MKKIRKYPLMLVRDQILEMPLNAEILTVQTQYGDPCLWAIVNPKELVMDRRHIQIYGTGHEITIDNFTTNKELKYISTFQMEGEAVNFKMEGEVGETVFHVFEVAKFRSMHED